MAESKGKTALITGATDGVGRVVARALGKDGWRVLVHGRDRARGEALVREIEQGSGSAVFFAADLASLAEVRGLAEAVRATTDRLDLLINSDPSPVIGGGAPSCGAEGESHTRDVSDSDVGISRISFEAFPLSPLRGHLPRKTAEDRRCVHSLAAELGRRMTLVVRKKMRSP